MPGDRSDVVEVGVVVQHRCSVVLCRRGGEKIHDACGAMLAACCEQRLDLAGARCDLLHAGELDELAADPGDTLVFTGVASRVA